MPKGVKHIQYFGLSFLVALGLLPAAAFGRPPHPMSMRTALPHLAASR
jgi:hypothetical protein